MRAAPVRRVRPWCRCDARAGGHWCEEQRNTFCANTVGTNRSGRGGGDPRCDAHRHRHRHRDHRRWWGLRVHGEGEQAHRAPQAQEAAVEVYAAHTAGTRLSRDPGARSG